eukprot:5648485-Pyramimonas_sp.AAC.1
MSNLKLVGALILFKESVSSRTWRRNLRGDDGGDGFEAEVRGGKAAHGLPLIIGHSRGGAALEQQHHHLVPAAGRREEERRLAVVVKPGGPPVRVRSEGQQRPHLLRQLMV